MRTGVLAVALLGLVPCAKAAEVQLLDPGVFGHSTADAVELLFDKKAGETEPALVQVDIACGKYYAATVTYPHGVTLGEIKASLNARYGDHVIQPGSTTLALWRVEDQRVAISLSEEGGVCKVIYITFGGRGDCN